MTTTSLTIDRGVPMPRREKYPFLEMEIGDSFAVPLASRAIVSSKASLVGTLHGTKFSCRRVGGQVRVWRVA